MTPRIKSVSAFSGIGGFERGMARHGFDFTHQIEWDQHCQTILRRHFPDAELRGDISDVTGSEVGRPDLYVGGFPCNDTSVGAPHRRGLGGSRSGHFFEFVRLVEETQRIVDESRPRWVVIENPEGLLRSNDGRDMATVVGSLEDLGYGWAYRVVDGRHFGTPQRRRRVLVVGHRGGDPRPAWQVLGDGDPGSEPARPGRVGRGSRQGGPRPVGGVAGDALVWRKSARARASLSAGGYETWVTDGDGNTLAGYDGGLATRQTHLILQAGRLRTLTLTEWERLQGFPDGWTEGVPESMRYTMLGNAMHTGMSNWLGGRMAAVHAAVPMLSEGSTR